VFVCVCVCVFRILLRDVVTSMTSLAVLVFTGSENDAWSNKASYVAVAVLLLTFVFPISLNRSLGGLAFVTPLSLGSVMVLLLSVCVRGTMHAYNDWDTLEYHMWPQSGLGILKALPIFSKFFFFVVF
jgi:hypothetical protein